VTQPASVPPATSRESYERAVQEVVRGALAFVNARWGEAQFTDAAMVAFVDDVVPVVLAAQQQVAALTSVHLAHLTGIDPLPVPATLYERGVAPEAVYQRPIVAARRALAEGKSVAQARLAGERRLESLVRTDIQMAKVRQADRVMRAAGVRFYKRVPKGAATCALCLIASTQRYKVGKLLPIHPGCVPAGTAVSTPPRQAGVGGAFGWGALHAVTRRKFEGELVEFATARGDKVRVTPNHPVLTEKGWVPAHLLGEGDTVFRRLQREWPVGCRPNVDQGPVLVEDVFDAARMAFPLVRVPLAAEDFHADGADGEVEIVYTNGYFPAERDAELVEVVGERLLVDAGRAGVAFDGGGAFGSLVPGGASAARCGVCGGSLGFPLLGRHFGGAELAGFGSVTRFDAPAEEFGPDSAAGYASKGFDLKRRLAGLVEGDRVVEFRRVGFSGHVFNLHTNEGWYGASNYIVSNCDCGVEPLPGDKDPGHVIDEDLLEATHARVAAIMGEADRGGRNPDYRKLIVTHEHGEIGPLVAWKGDRFTGRSQIPDEYWSPLPSV